MHAQCIPPYCIQSCSKPPHCPAGLERLKALLQTKALFQRHASSKEALRSAMSRITVVEGDVHREDCGLSAADLARLRADVDIVIHSAASISFFEHVHVLLQQNYQVLSVQQPMQGPVPAVAQNAHEAAAMWDQPKCVVLCKIS